MTGLKSPYLEMRLTEPEVWLQGWRQLFLVRVQATVTSPLERFTYYFFHQTVANGAVCLSGAGAMMWEYTLDVSGWMPQMFWGVFHEALFCVSTLFFRDIY